MTEFEPFLRAMESDPDSDVPRLISADWLEERGDRDRAEFVRAQCEAYRIRYGPPPRADKALSADERKRLQQLTARAAELLSEHRDAWTAGLPEWTRYVGFQRGFQDFYYFTGKQLVEDGTTIRKLAPLAGYLSLRLTEGEAATAFACEHLAQITRLDLDGCELTDADVKRLTASRHLGMVKQLNLSRGMVKANRLSDAAAVAIAAAKNLPSLTSLNLCGAYEGLTAAGVTALIESPLRAGLTWLNLSNGPAWLNLSHGPADPSFAEPFRSSRFRLTALKTLALGRRGLGDVGAVSLAECPHLANLSELTIYENDVTDAGASAILKSPHLRGLRVIDFSRNPRLTNATARLLLADTSRQWDHVALYGSEVSEALRAKVLARCSRQQPRGVER